MKLRKAEENIRELRLHDAQPNRAPAEKEAEIIDYMF